MRIIYSFIFAILLFGATVESTYAQDRRKEMVGVDTTEIAVIDQTNDRNVMLNAANNTGPRDVNIGLPASIGGTTVLENAIPVVYFYWPELPTKAWRQDATINRVHLYDLGNTAIRIGDVGFSVDTYDNLGTDVFQGNGNITFNHFGLMRNDLNLSGPIGQNGWKYTIGAYTSYDPGTYRPAQIDRFYSDQAHLYKAGITKDYAFSSGSGTITAFYKYANIRGLTSEYSPFIYGEDGKISELEGFKIGRNSYFERSGKITLRDAFSGKYETRDIINDYGAESHNIDLIGKNTFNNNTFLNFNLRFHRAKTGHYLPIMAGVEEVEPGTYTYEDGTPFNGQEVQNVLILASKRTPTTTFMATIEGGKIWEKHQLTVGLNQWYYNIDKFATEAVIYSQEVAPDPRKLLQVGGPQDAYGNIPNGFEYHNGYENKTALYILDTWDISDVVTVNLGGRLEYQALRGDYQDASLGLDHLNGPKTDIKKDWLNKALMFTGVYKITGTFGILGEGSYNEQAGHLENYSIGQDPDLKQSKILGGGLGIFYNHPIANVVSKATYIQRDQYRTTVNFSNPNNYQEVKREITNYDISTFGWTTDVQAKPFRNFDLHFLFTWQLPKYKNYTGTVLFDDGSESTYDFSDRYVTGVSKFLIEIDPSYTWNDLRIWASARYFSKQYFNKPNTLSLAGRWETFAGAGYKINEHLDLGLTVVNLLNQRGANGSIPDADLILTEEQTQSKIGQIMSGTYIRPFTVEVGLKYRF